MLHDGVNVAGGPAAKAPARANRFNVELIYKPVGSEPDPLVGGRFSLPAGGSVVGYTLELANQQTKWRSGQITLNESAAFQLNIRAEPGIQNVFTLELRDPTGNICETDPGEFAYTMGVVVDEQPIINNVGVAMADNRIGIHFNKGQGLPAKSTRTYRTALGVRAGESGSVLRITIHEGRNRQVGRMCETVGLPVVRLVRARIGPLTDSSLRPGDARELTRDEVRALERAVAGTDRPAPRE